MRSVLITMVSVGSATLAVAGPLQPVSGIGSSVSTAGAKQSTSPPEYQDLRTGLFQQSNWPLSFWQTHCSTPIILKSTAPRSNIPPNLMLALTLLVSAAFAWPAVKGIIATMRASDRFAPTTTGTLAASTVAVREKRETETTMKTTTEQGQAAANTFPGKTRSKMATKASVAQHTTTETLPVSTVTVTVTRVGTPENQEPELPNHLDYEQGDSFPGFQDWILDIGELATDLIHTLATKIEHDIGGEVAQNTDGDENNSAPILGHDLKQLIADAEDGAQWAVSMLGQAIIEAISHDEWLQAGE